MVTVRTSYIGRIRENVGLYRCRISKVSLYVCTFFQTCSTVPTTYTFIHTYNTYTCTYVRTYLHTYTVNILVIVGSKMAATDGQPDRQSLAVVS